MENTYVVFFAILPASIHFFWYRFSPLMPNPLLAGTHNSPQRATSKKLIRIVHCGEISNLFQKCAKTYGCAGLTQCTEYNLANHLFLHTRFI